MHDEITSLRQLYSQENIPSTAAPEIQIPLGAVFLCTHGAIIRVLKHITPKWITNRKEGGNFAIIDICKLLHVMHL